MSFKLTPVIELPPYKYSQTTEPPDYSKPVSEKQKHEYWASSLAEAGLDPAPVIEGSWFVAIETLSDANLKIFLHKETHDEGVAIPLEEQGPLSGGMFIASDDCHIEPQCCGGLEDIGQWQELEDLELNLKTAFWMGHPAIYITRHEQSYTIVTDEEWAEVREVIVEEKTLLREVSKARTLLDSFFKRVESLLQGEDTKERAEALVFGL